MSAVDPRPLSAPAGGGQHDLGVQRDRSLPGPFPVGDYAAALRRRLRRFARVQLVGELVNLRPPTRTRVYFELRDGNGALPCAMWREDWERTLAAQQLEDGMQVVAVGGCDYYPGSASASPAFSFVVSALRPAGEGDLRARIERLRRQLAAEGLLEPQKRLRRPALPRTIGVVTAEGGKARDDLLAGLQRRGWSGRLVWAFVPVQDRHAAPAIRTALADLLAAGGVEVIVIARGGGSIGDLLAFSDEALCRTVAMLPIPVIASVGHHTDRTVLDDVAAVSCSTPTHAAEAAVPVDCTAALASTRSLAQRLAAHGRRAVLARAKLLERQARAPAVHLDRERAGLHQIARELRAASRRRLATELGDARRAAGTLERRQAATLAECGAGRLRLSGLGAELRRSADPAQRARALEHLRLALAGHDPRRTLERGYALVEDRDGGLVTGVEAARAARSVRLRFADGHVGARIEEEEKE